MYKGGSFKFTFAINNNYPHDAPKVKCVPKVSFVSLCSSISFSSLESLTFLDEHVTDIA